MAERTRAAVGLPLASRAVRIIPLMCEGCKGCVEKGQWIANHSPPSRAMSKGDCTSALSCCRSKAGTLSRTQDAPPLSARSRARLSCLH